MKTIFAALAAVAAALPTHAASLSLVPTTDIHGATVGDAVSFDIVMDFTGTPTIGGVFDVVFDSEVLQFESFFRDPAIGSTFSMDPTVEDGRLDDWLVAAATALPDVAVLGSVSFTLLGTPPWTVALTDSRDGGAGTTFGGWFSATDFVSEIPVDYGSVTVVPLPAAAWTLLGALVTLAGLRRMQ